MHDISIDQNSPVKKKVIISSGLWFPLIDGLAVYSLFIMRISPIILVHRPYNKKKKITLSARLFYNKKNKYIVLCEYSKKVLIKEYNIAESNITTLPHPNFKYQYDKIKIDHQLKNKLMKWKKNRPIFLYLSGITKDHGISNLSNIIRKCFEKKLPYCFLICGNTRNREQFILSRTIYKKFENCENVQCYFNFYSNTQAKTWLSVSQGVLLPYLEIVQSGVQMLALGQGVPVICQKIGGLSEPVISGWNGIIVNGKSTAMWIDGMEALLSVTASKAEIIHHAEQKYGAESTCQTITQLLSG
ncbi:Glycosyltransferase involved in cell wall bisynthesis [Candidatus Electrothrix aarhusensis]|uniref:Glycosyltransferase involved in cell wall bisynthesis n=1 Tax=Candidatus Electrothrix aarhusensis TaxID=1859131 RepID=A0A444IWI1_9BACT|nr:Glycosyltransferase involved in cell wall bisynthesis [Candidatus Electrothrix aarhusensis]